ncbi:guanylate kinase [Alistipes sp. OttesenSCG-928-B03]|nr:guanylate kinase [Alistipes sp. OttesenSCG-928-B03]
MKPIIIAICGVSGSGKTYLTRYLQNELNVPAIISHTTRPRRDGETEGEDYFFIDSTDGYKRSDMLTYTQFGGHEYFSLKKQLPKSGFCTYVVDENGIRALKQNAGEDYGVFVVTVQCRPESRIARGISPERIERDRNREPLDFMWVDYAIYNDGTVEEFKKAAIDMIKVLEQWQHLR